MSKAESGQRSDREQEKGLSENEIFWDYKALPESTWMEIENLWNTVSELYRKRVALFDLVREELRDAREKEKLDPQSIETIDDMKEIGIYPDDEIPLSFGFRLTKLPPKKRAEEKERILAKYSNIFSAAIATIGEIDKDRSALHRNWGNLSGILRKLKGSVGGNFWEEESRLEEAYIVAHRELRHRVDQLPNINSPERLSIPHPTSLFPDENDHKLRTLKESLLGEKLPKDHVFRTINDVRHFIDDYKRNAVPVQVLLEILTSKGIDTSDIAQTEDEWAMRKLLLQKFAELIARSDGIPSAVQQTFRLLMVNFFYNIGYKLTPFERPKDTLKLTGEEFYKELERRVGAGEMTPEAEVVVFAKHPRNFLNFDAMERQSPGNLDALLRLRGQDPDA